MDGAPAWVLFVANILIELFQFHLLTQALTLQLTDRRPVPMTLILVEEDHERFSHPGESPLHPGAPD